MIGISKITDLNFIKNWLESTGLDEKGLHDSYLNTASKYEFLRRMDVDWVRIMSDDKVIALANTKHFTDQYLELHICADPKLKFQFLSIWPCVEAYFKDTSDYKGLLIYVPQDCGYVIKWCNKLGFEMSGAIPNGIVWRKKLNNLIIMTKMLRSN